MNLQHVKELNAIIECGSLSAAAPKLGYTLSALSKSIGTLEKEFGFQLLYRGKKGVKPTKECERILPYIQDLLNSEKRLNQEMATIKGLEQGEICIGTAYRHYYRWLSEVTLKYHELHPGITFRFYNGISSQCIDLLHKHAIDFCLISKRDGNHQWYTISEDPLMAIVSINNPLSKKKKVSLKDFETQPCIETCPEMDGDSRRFFMKHNVVRNVQFSTMDIQATYAMVDANMGISTTNRMEQVRDYPGICHLPITPSENIELGLACDEKMSPINQSFLEFILPQLPKNL